VVVDANGEILADSIAEERSVRYPPFAPLVDRTGWIAKLRLLASRNISYYQVQREMGRVKLPLSS